MTLRPAPLPDPAAPPHAVPPVAHYRFVLMLRGLGLLIVLAAYWAPWVAHPSAGLAIAEIDFNEFPKFMPQVRSGELEVWREAFYLTLLGPAAALVVWAAGPGTRHSLTSLARPSLAGVRAAIARSPFEMSVARWLVRVFALGLTITPSIFNVFESGEFATQLRMLAVVAVLIVLSPLIRRLPFGLCALLLAGWFIAVALLPAREFLNLLPALADIYHRTLTIGWGFYAALGGFALLVVIELVQIDGRFAYNLLIMFRKRILPCS